MKTLEDAWAWCGATREGARRLDHLAKYWDRLPWDSPAGALAELSRDNVFRELDGEQMRADAARTVSELDDLAILILFSVFEAEVRDWVRDRVLPETSVLTEPLLVDAAKDVIERIKQGSFARLLTPYKAMATAELVEAVNQVRDYRNWVAHGRREDMRPNENVVPREAYDRLSRFLAALRGPVA